jgi:hypothetical protein
MFVLILIRFDRRLNELPCYLAIPQLLRCLASWRFFSQKGRILLRPMWVAERETAFI